VIYIEMPYGLIIRPYDGHRVSQSESVFSFGLRTVIAMQYLKTALTYIYTTELQCYYLYHRTSVLLFIPQNFSAIIYTTELQCYYSYIVRQ